MSKHILKFKPENQSYYWINNQVVIDTSSVFELVTLDIEHQNGLLLRPCYDPLYTIAPFGYFTGKVNAEIRKINEFTWNPLKPSQVSKKFLTSLTLLGVLKDAHI